MGVGDIFWHVKKASKRTDIEMKPVQINRYGGSEVIEINQNTPEPTVSAGEVLINVKAAGVNPADWKIREGGFQQMIHLQFPSILGMDFSGVIKQVGEGASNSEFKQGDEVYGQAGVINGGSGAFAEIALANTENIAIKPKRLSHTDAAASLLVGVSAWRALNENIEIIKWSADSNSWRGRRYRINCYTDCQELGSIRRDHGKRK